MHAKEQAEILTAQGFRLIPTLDKVAQVYEDEYGKAHPTATWEPDQFMGAFFKVAILCGPCPALGPDFHLICLDLDGDVAGCPVLVEFLATLPRTLTSHNGRHLFFAVPIARVLEYKQWADVFRTKAAFGAAIDMKTDGGFAEESWDWAPETDLSDLPAQIADLPDAALDAIIAARGKVPDSVAGLAHDHRGQAYLEAAKYNYAEVLADAEKWLRTSAPIPVEGTGGVTLLVVIGGLMVGFGLSDDVTAELAADVYYPRAWPGEDVEDDQLWHKIDTITEQGSSTFEELELAALYRNMRDEHADQVAAAAPVAPTPPAPTPTPLDLFPREDLSGCVLCPKTGWPYILQKGNRFWLHVVDKFTYHQEVTATELEAAVARHLHNQVAASCSALKDLRKVYIRPVKLVKYTYSARTTVYDPKSDTLTVAALQWADLKPTFHPHIDKWLRAMWAGSDYDAGAQWLAACVALDRPATCLFIHGDAEVGKGLLASGIARLWGQPYPGSMEEVVGNFNSCLEECPLVFADEGFPEKMTFEWLRRASTLHRQRLNKKGLQEFNIEGCARYLIAANNNEILRFQRMGSLTRKDIHAIGERILVLPCQPEARDAVRTFDTNKAAHHEIAEHVLWLAKTVPLEDESRRMASKSGGGSELLTSIVAARYQEVLELFEQLMDASGDDPQARETWGWLDLEAGLVRVSIPALLARCQMMDKFKLSNADLKAFCASHCRRPGGIQWRGPEKNLMVRELDLKLLQDSIDTLK